jgi:hypothetical protein
MSFGPSSTTKTSENDLSGLYNTAIGHGLNLMNSGTGNLQQGTNFFSNILNGNQAEGAAALAPDINRIQQANQGTLQGVSTLMPRGGGRSGTLFDLPFQQNRQIQSLYNPLRSSAATNLAQIGQGQIGAGTNLFGVGGNAAGQLGDLGQRQQQITNSMWSGLGQGLFGLATTPFGGGAAMNGLLGML